MGVGKSALGRKAARELGMRFIDSDHQIEKEQGKKIPGIFADEGESYFRNLERQFIESGHPEVGCVVSCGGGLVVEPGMKELLKEKGVVICLFASAESIIERTSRNKNRPLLNVDDPAAKVRALLEGRYNVSFEDIRRVYLPALRRRVVLNFEAQAEGMETDQVLLDILEKLPEKSDDVIAAAVVSD